MKKILSLVVLAILLTACGSSETTKNQNDDQKQENTENIDTENKEIEKEEEQKKQVIKKGEKVVINDYAEITVKGNNFGKTIKPPNPGDFYNYYENEEENQIYLDTVISVKSLLTNQKTSDEFLNVKIIYDNKYEYSTFSTIEDKGGTDFTFSNITPIEPLNSGTLHFLASVPSEIEKDNKPLKAIITINGNDYEQIIR